MKYKRNLPIFHVVHGKLNVSESRTGVILSLTLTQTIRSLDEDLQGATINIRRAQEVKHVCF